MIATALFTLLGLMLLAIPVAAAMGVLGMVLAQMYAFLPVSRVAGEIAWTSSNEFLLVALPLFILLGELLLRSGLAEKMYEALARWLSWLPGGLMHSNIAACALVCRHLGLQRGHRGDGGHGGAAAGAALRLQRAALPGHAWRPAARWAS